MADELLTAEHFEPHVGKVVRFKGTDQTLRIDKIVKFGAAPFGLTRAPFTVIFSGPRGPERLVAEGTYDCRVEHGPSWVLYLIPVHTMKPDRQEYQAAFN